MSATAPVAPTAVAREPEIIATGIPGLDYILNGGFVRRRLYLVEGVPGSGKTTLALQFLMEGARRGERVSYIALSETADELRATADSHGWDLSGIDIRAVTPSSDSLKADQQYTMFHPSEVELSETVQAVLDEVDSVRPARLVFDSLSELRLLAANPLRYRRQVLALKTFFSERDCTVLLLDDRSYDDRELQVQTIAHGVITLEQRHPEYGVERRRLRIMKYRGVKFHGGYHDLVIRRGGLDVFPRLVAAEHRGRSSRELLKSGIGELDALLGGGIERGTSTLIGGAPGTGKSSLAAQFAVAAAERGEGAALFIFDESADTLVARMEGLGIGLRRHVESGRVQLQEVDPAELSPGEFSHRVAAAAETGHASVIVIDSLNGYVHAMPEEGFLAAHVHELLTRLGQLGVATILVGVHQGLIGSSMQTPADATYLADAVIILRYFEFQGEVKQAIAVMKKRGGSHERSLREFRLDGGGMRVGAPLHEFRGVLTGVPVYEGRGKTFLEEDWQPGEPTPG